MDEMNNMNEVTTEEETPIEELTPVVETKPEVHAEEENSGDNFWGLVIKGGAVAGALGLGALVAHCFLPLPKKEKQEKKPKAKVCIKVQPPLVFVRNEPEEIKDVDFNEIPEPEKEEEKED